MKIRLILLVIILFFLNSCKIIPFFIPKERVKIREKDKLERLENRKSKTEKEIEKKIDKNGKTPTKKVKKLEKIESKIPKDSLISGVDSTNLIKAKSKVETRLVSDGDWLLAQKIITSNPMPFHFVKLKTKMEYSNGSKSQSFNAQFRIEMDKQIWVSISAISLELARAVIRPDSVYALDQFNKKYYAFSYDEIIKLINVNIDFKSLQDIILGLPLGTEGDVFEYNELGATVTVGLKGEEFLNKLVFNKSDSTLQQLHVQVLRGSYASNILGLLSEYILEKNVRFSNKRTYNVEDSKGRFTLEMDVKKVEFDPADGVEMPFSIPKNFKPAME